MKDGPANRAAQKIATLQVQGAASIARESLNALAETIHSNKTSEPRILLSQCQKACQTLSLARPTEPFLINSLTWTFQGINHSLPIRPLRNSLLSKISFILETYKRDHRYISDLISRKVPKNGIVFTHCHSSTVVSGLIKAWKMGIKFAVHNTEARPLYQGRKTASELSKNGITVMQWADSAAIDAIQHADLALFGCDAIYTNGAANKIGTRLFCRTAKAFGVPTYLCTHSLKFDTRSLTGKNTIEERAPEELWPNPPKGVRAINPAFDIVEPEYIDGIISEQGVLPHNSLINQIKDSYPWLFTQNRLMSAGSGLKRF